MFLVGGGLKWKGDRFRAVNLFLFSNAPYQPLLLLSVIDLIAENKIESREIRVTNKLINRFNKNRNLLSYNAFKGNLVLPFFYLKNSQLWKLKFSDTYEGGRPLSIPKLKLDVDYALLDEQVFNLLQSENNRQQLVDTLLEVYFASSDKSKNEVLEINRSFFEYELENYEINSTSAKQNKTYLKKSIVRNAFFRKAIVHLYEYHCAVCKIKVQSSIGQNIVDGAHIKPLSIFYDNDISNGISLCKNHHWAFDNGLFAIDNDYRVIVARNFTENSPNAKSIQEFSGEKLLLPKSKFKEFYPRLDALKWHRDRVFRLS